MNDNSIIWKQHDAATANNTTVVFKVHLQSTHNIILFCAWKLLVCY